MAAQMYTYRYSHLGHVPVSCGIIARARAVATCHLPVEGPPAEWGFRAQPATRNCRELNPHMARGCACRALGPAIRRPACLPARGFVCCAGPAKQGELAAMAQGGPARVVSQGRPRGGKSGVLHLAILSVLSVCEWPRYVTLKAGRPQNAN